MSDQKLVIKPTDLVMPHFAVATRHRIFAPPVYQIVPDGDGGAAIADQFGHIMNRDEFERLLPLLMAFFGRNSDEQIGDLNVAFDACRRREDEALAGRKPATKTKIVSGFIYVVRCDGFCKIGRTKRLTERIAKFATTYPHDLTVIRTARVPDMIGIEAELHQLFDAKRVRGEWFNLDDADLKLVAEMLPDTVEVQR